LFLHTLLVALMLGCSLWAVQEPAGTISASQSDSRPQETTQPTQSPSPPTITEQAPSHDLVSPEQQAWNILESGAQADKKEDRAAAVHVTGLIPNNLRARRIAETALKDEASIVRAAAAAALGDMKSRRSTPKLKAATDDKDPAVALAAAHSLLQLNDDAGYAVYYEILTGERKTGKGLLAEAAAYKDPKKLAQIGFEEGLGFIPYGGIGWRAVKMVKKDDASPARAAAASVLAKDHDPDVTKALVNAAGDKNWVVRAAALEALAKRGDTSALDTVQLYLLDQEGEVKYTAAAATIRLLAIKGTAKRAK
jgi:HEAT repeat protein